MHKYCKHRARYDTSLKEGGFQRPHKSSSAGSGSNHPFLTWLKSVPTENAHIWLQNQQRKPFHFAPLCAGEAVHFPSCVICSIRSVCHSGKLSVCHEIDTKKLRTKGASVGLLEAGIHPSWISHQWNTWTLCKQQPNEVVVHDTTRGFDAKTDCQPLRNREGRGGGGGWQVGRDHKMFSFKKDSFVDKTGRRCG